MSLARGEKLFLRARSQRVKDSTHGTQRNASIRGRGIFYSRPGPMSGGGRRLLTERRKKNLHCFKKRPPLPKQKTTRTAKKIVHLGWGSRSGRGELTTPQREVTPSLARKNSSKKRALPQGKGADFFKEPSSIFLDAFENRVRGTVIQDHCGSENLGFLPKALPGKNGSRTRKISFPLVTERPGRGVGSRRGKKICPLCAPYLKSEVVGRK